MKENKELNIDIKKAVKILIADKRNLLIYACLTGIIGVLLAYARPRTYESVVILAPEESGKGFTGSISSIASLVGMDLSIGKTGDALYPEIYPQLMASSSFLVDLFPVKVAPRKSSESITYQKYIDDYQKIAFYAYPLKWMSHLMERIRGGEEDVATDHQPDPYNLTIKEDKTARTILEKIRCSVDKKTSVITIVVKDQDPVVAANVADSIQVHLQKAITDYRTRKARIDLDFMQRLYEDAHRQYVDARRRYAAFGDANSRIALHSVQSRLDELKNDLQLKFIIYQKVVEQLQLAKAKVQEQTPAFTIIQGARVPVKARGISKIVTLFIWMVIGLFIRMGILAWKNREDY